MPNKNMKLTSVYFIDLTTADILELLRLKDPIKYKDVIIEMAVALHPDEIEMQPDDPTGLFFFSEYTPLCIQVSEV